MCTDVATWTPNGENLVALRSVKHTVGLTRHMAFNSCFLYMGRAQKHLEKVDENLRYKFKTIRLEGLAP